MSRRRWVFGMVLTLTLTGCAPANDVGAAPTAATSAPAPASAGICSLISPATLEDAYGPMKVLRSDPGPVTASAVRGSCDYFNDETFLIRVFFTINVNADPTRANFETLLANTTTKEPHPVAGAEVYAIDGGMLRLVAYKNGVTFDLGLKVGPDIASTPKDTAVGLALLEQALSHY